MLTYRLRIYLHPILFKCLPLYWLVSYFSVPLSSYGSLLLALHFPKPLYPYVHAGRSSGLAPGSKPDIR